MVDLAEVVLVAADSDLDLAVDSADVDSVLDTDGVVDTDSAAVGVVLVGAEAGVDQVGVVVMDSDVHTLDVLGCTRYTISFKFINFSTL